MNKYSQYFNVRETPQHERIPGREDMAVNEAGGYTWPIDDWQRLRRFLILGSEANTYYVKARELTIQNAEAVLRCIKQDGPGVVAITTDVSTSGRAPKNDPALFVLAMCAGLGNTATRATALYHLPEVARTGTHLFTFINYVQGFRGWGRGLRSAVSAWYTGKKPGRLTYQLIKYRQRGGWTHRDLLRLAHPRTTSEPHKTLFDWVCRGNFVQTDESAAWQRMLASYEAAQVASSEDEIVKLIDDGRLPWEAIDTKWLKSPRIWDVLLPNLPLTALMRNLGRMSRIGLLAPLSDASRSIVERFANVDALRRSRLHPFNILVGMKTYASGHGFRGSLSWTPISQVVDALDAAFYESFGNVTPTGKRLVLAIDVSGSMNTPIGGSPVTVREAAAAMCMVTARVEPQYTIIAFSNKMVEIEVSPRERLDDVVEKFRAMPFGGTDCALPMLWAMGYNRSGSHRGSYRRSGELVKESHRQVAADCFIIYTDHETWAGTIHPAQALQQYRKELGIAAKLVTVAMTSEGFTIADPQDGGMLDVVGFDGATPSLITEFVNESPPECHTP